MSSGDGAFDVYLMRSRLFGAVAGGERLDRVLVATASGVVTLPWSSRFELLERVRRLHGGAEVLRRFEAVGATRPIHTRP